MITRVVYLLDPSPFLSNIPFTKRTLCTLFCKPFYCTLLTHIIYTTLSKINVSSGTVTLTGSQNSLGIHSNSGSIIK